MKITGITKQELQFSIEQFQKFANTYYWTPQKSASGRRNEERRNSHKWFFEVDGIEVSAAIEVTCSCHNYYCVRSVYVGEESKKMMVPYLKKLLEKGEFSE